MQVDLAVERVRRVYEADHERLWRSLFAFCGSRALADDAVAEAFAQVLRRGDQIDDVDESQQWTRIESFAQECCGAGDFIWVGRDGGVVFAVNQDHVRVWYPQDRSDATVAAALTE